MKKEKKYCGVVVPVVTPVTATGALDESAVERIVGRLAAVGVAPLLMGTTGEGHSVSVEKAVQLVKAAKRAANGRVLVYVGLCGCCIEEQTKTARLLTEAGADVLAATLPSYYALTPEQMETFYRQLATQLTVPLMLYNITITTHMSIPLDVVERLSHHPNIVGLKDSENNIERMKEALALFADRADFSYFCGCAANSAVAMAGGADGIVPSVGNYWPEAYQQLYEAGRDGRQDEAGRWQTLTSSIGRINTEGLTLGQSLAGLKVIMKMLGLCEEHMLPPLTELSDDQKESIRNRFREFCASHAPTITPHLASTT